MVTSRSTPTDTTVDWRLDVDDVPLLRTLRYVPACVLGGFAVLVVALLGWLVIAALLSGNVIRALGLFVLAILGLLSRRYVPALLASDVGEPLWCRYSLRWLAGGSVLGALLLLGSARLHAGAPLAVFVASCVPLVLAAHFPTTGAVDVAAETLVVDGTAVPLDAVRGHRTVTAGPFAVYWLSYARGNPNAPRLLVVPTDCTEPITALLERSPNTPAPAETALGATERWIVLGFGIGLLAVGPALWVALPPGGGRLVALYAGALFGLFGALFLWYAVTA